MSRTTINYHKVTLLFFLGILLLGIGHIGLLPPFEGIDETAHYSRILTQPILDKHVHAPEATRNDLKTIAAEVFDYAAHGPMPYEWLKLHAVAPSKSETEHPPYMTYGEFFSNQKLVARYNRELRLRPAVNSFVASAEDNWQFQHPPLYYQLFGFIARILPPTLPFIDKLFMLRAASFLLAHLGLLIGLAATWRYLRLNNNPAAKQILGFAGFYPFLMPSYFSDLARLGNDSLCLFSFGIIWAIMLHVLHAPERRLTWIALGVSLGVACWIKATLLPVALLGPIFLAFAIKASTSSFAQGRRIWVSALIATGVATIILSPWYAPQFLAGAIPGSSEITALTSPNVTPYLTFQQNWSFQLFTAMTRFTFLSAVWLFSSWSIALDLVILNLANGMSFIALIIMCAHILTIFSRTHRDPMSILAPLLIALMLLCLVTKIFLGFFNSVWSVDKAVFAPGYYIHVLAPALAIVCGTGINAVRQISFGKTLVTAIIGGAIVAQAYIFWSNMMLWGGCAVIGLHRLRIIDDAPLCLNHGAAVIRNLAILSFPAIALPALGIGFALTMLGWWFSEKMPQPDRPLHAQ